MFPSPPSELKYDVDPGHELKGEEDRLKGDNPRPRGQVTHRRGEGSGILRF